MASRFAEKHGQSRGLPLWAWSGGALLIVAAIVGVVLAMSGDDETPVAHLPRQPAKVPRTEPAPPSPPVEDAFASATNKPGQPDVEDPYAPGLLPTKTKVEEKALEKPRPGAPIDEYVRYAEHAIVKLDVYSDDWNQMDSLGSGFIIDVEERLVVTNYHVLSSAVKAGVKFNNGVRYGVLG